MVGKALRFLLLVNLPKSPNLIQSQPNDLGLHQCKENILRIGFVCQRKDFIPPLWISLYVAPSKVVSKRQSIAHLKYLRSGPQEHLAPSSGELAPVRLPLPRYHSSNVPLLEACVEGGVPKPRSHAIRYECNELGRAEAPAGPASERTAMMTLQSMPKPAKESSMKRRGAPVVKLHR